ncbi:hypothetical protein [Streptomyces sp. NBC_01637]|uniref:hypothetical protein n=1 Tax=unclassified Streptomyces TaxID=2593676 RepID=UPI00386F124A|nr:hypothetical protein OH719_11365 [Streptomyces sp. NBC_01653]WTD92456.1 hypothetical protein OG891_35505 [Streptomyces sp. NBC_01637]
MTETTTGPVSRADLLALTPDTLTALSNRGLVKRATKELDAGTAPSLTTEPDTTVRARFDDGITAVLPPGVGLDTGSCSCAAPGVCRHLVALVLAYQRDAGAGTDGAPVPVPVTDWSPGSTDDRALADALGARTVAAARRTFERGYGALVHRPTAERPEPWVELPTCTVRFPVPGEIAYALTDAAAAVRDEMVALAVWAFRFADEAGTEDRSTTVQVGGRPTARPTARPELDAAAALADELLREGVAHAGPVLRGALARAGDALAAGSLHWPAGAVAELTGQLAAYADRAAHYRPELVAALLTEVHARRRAAAVPGALGTREAGDTPLRRVRLTALGCRVRGTAEALVAEVYFAHPGAGSVLVLRREWTADGQELTGHRLATRRVLSTSLSALATGSLVSESVRRTASRALTIARGRLGTTSITPVGAAWAELPEPLLVRDLSALTARWRGRPPRLIRPRVEAESVRVVALSEVGSIGYDPAEQCLEAHVRDAAGTSAVLTSAYRPECPGALDALADALGSGATHVSGSVHRSGGGIVIDPIAVLTPAGVTVPDLAAGDGSTDLAAAGSRSPDPLTAALDEAISALAAAAHSGLSRPTTPTRTRIDEAATALSRTGLARAAALLRAFLNALDGQAENGRSAAWLEAQLHLLVSSELRAAES